MAVLDVSVKSRVDILQEHQDTQKTILILDHR